MRKLGRSDGRPKCRLRSGFEEVQNGEVSWQGTKRTEEEAETGLTRCRQIARMTRGNSVGHSDGRPKGVQSCEKRMKWTNQEMSEGEVSERKKGM